MDEPLLVVEVVEGRRHRLDDRQNLVGRKRLQADKDRFCKIQSQTQMRLLRANLQLNKFSAFPTDHW